MRHGISIILVFLGLVSSAFAGEVCTKDGQGSGAARRLSGGRPGHGPGSHTGR